MEHDSKKHTLQAPNSLLFLDQKRKMKIVKQIKKSIAKFELTPDDIGFTDNAFSVTS